MATTLHRLMLGIWPFWGSGREDGLRYTRVVYPPYRLGRALLPVLRGRPRPWMLSNGYASGTARRLTLRLGVPVVLDGEFYTPEPGSPLVLEATRTLPFLHW